ncbi:MAG: hypothetical protein HQL25_03615 [Candidatus Omnitrophica bacterium]|nr:hypothetical protein [Candidatus Omnitrophota bacterium]
MRCFCSGEISAFLTRSVSIAMILCLVILGANMTAEEYACTALSSQSSVG